MTDSILKLDINFTLYSFPSFQTGQCDSLLALLQNSNINISKSYHIKHILVPISILSPLSWCHFDIYPFWIVTTYICMLSKLLLYLWLSQCCNKILNTTYLSHKSQSSQDDIMHRSVCYSLLSHFAEEEPHGSQSQAVDRRNQMVNGRIGVPSVLLTAEVDSFKLSWEQEEWIHSSCIIYLKQGSQAPKDLLEP